MPAGHRVEGLGRQLFVREEVDVELGGEVGRGGRVARAGCVGEGVRAEGVGEVGDPAVGVLVGG